MFNILSSSYFFTEVPDEISAGLYIHGCPYHCPNCHTPECWDTYGSNYTFTPLTYTNFTNIVNAYSKHITNIIFFGGDWDQSLLFFYLMILYNEFPNLKRTVYGGSELSDYNKLVLEKIDYLKTGKYIESLGGLQSSSTNQKLYRLVNGVIQEDITYKFWS